MRLSQYIAGGFREIDLPNIEEGRYKTGFVLVNDKPVATMTIVDGKAQSERQLALAEEGVTSFLSSNGKWAYYGHFPIRPFATPIEMVRACGEIQMEYHRNYGSLWLVESAFAGDYVRFAVFDPAIAGTLLAAARQLKKSSLTDEQLSLDQQWRMLA